MHTKDTSVPPNSLPKENDGITVKMGKYAIISSPNDFHAYYSQCGYDIPSHKEWVTLIINPQCKVGATEISGNTNFEELIRNALNVMWGVNISNKEIRNTTIVGKDNEELCELSFNVNYPNGGDPQCMLTASVGSDSTTIFLTTKEVEQLLESVKAMQKNIAVALEEELAHQEELAHLKAETENTIFNKIKKIALTEINIVPKKKG